MNSADMLRSARASGYGAGPKNDAQGSGDRVVSLTPEEMDAMKPHMHHADDMVVEATGSLSEDGKFNIQSIKYAPERGSSSEEEPMMVKTPTNISPS